MALSGRLGRGAGRTVRKAIRIPRSMGSAALALAYVGNGRFDAFIQQGGLSAWDIAAAGLIAERGGARVTAMDGGPWFDISHAPKSIGILAAPAAHHADAARPGAASRRQPRRASDAAACAAGRGPIRRRRPPRSRAGAPSQRSSSGSVLADLDAVVRRAQPGEVAVQERLVPVVAQRRGQRRSPGRRRRRAPPTSDASLGDRPRSGRSAARTAAAAFAPQPGRPG